MPGMTVLFVTRSGRTRGLAQDFGRRAGAEVHEIGDLVPRAGILGFLRAGAQSARRASTPIADPEVDLSAVDTVVLFQPVWASGVCPPIRTWLKAHEAELAGKRLGLALSNKGSEGAPLKAKFEAEFGPLAAFTVVRESLPPAEKAEALEAFLASLRGPGSGREGS